MVTVVNESKAYILPPEGSHLATCYSIVDLGTQPGSQQYPAPKRKLLVSWELSDELMEDGRPFVISKRYTMSINEKAEFRKHLEAWRNRKFTEDEAKKFNTDAILGKSCLLSISHNTATNGNTYANILSIAALPKGMTPKQLVNPLVNFDLDNFDQDAFGKLQDWQKDVIAKSPEYQHIVGGYVPEQNGDHALDDSIPF